MVPHLRGVREVELCGLDPLERHVDSSDLVFGPAKRPEHDEVARRLGEDYPLASPRSNQRANREAHDGFPKTFGWPAMSDAHPDSSAKRSTV